MEAEETRQGRPARSVQRCIFNCERRNGSPSTVYTIQCGEGGLRAPGGSQSDTCPRGSPTRAMELASGPNVVPCSSDPPARMEHGARASRIRPPPWYDAGGGRGGGGLAAAARRSAHGAARSWRGREGRQRGGEETRGRDDPAAAMAQSLARSDSAAAGARCLNLCLAGRACSPRSEEHTSELQSQ